MLRTDAIVLKRTATLNNDVFLTLLTEHKGKLDVVARRARLMTSPLAAGSKLFVYGTYHIETRGKTPRLASCDIIESHYQLLSDYDALMLATYFAEVISSIVQQGVNENESFELLRNLLHFTARSTISGKLLRALFLVKLTASLGWMPQLSSCALCGNELTDPLYFDAAAGAVCSNCTSNGQRVSAKWLRLLAYLRNVPFDRIHRANIEEIELNRTILCMESYLRFHAELPVFQSTEYLI